MFPFCVVLSVTVLVLRIAVCSVQAQHQSKDISADDAVSANLPQNECNCHDILGENKQFLLSQILGSNLGFLEESKGICNGQ